MRILFLLLLLHSSYIASTMRLHEMCHNTIHSWHIVKCIHNKQFSACATCFPLCYHYCKYQCPCIVCCQRRCNNFFEAQRHCFMAYESEHE